MAISTALHIVSGKGGTGKTSVATALAMSLATSGTKVLLCEVEGRQGIAQLFDIDPLPYEERLLAVSQSGGEVYALAIDPEAALLEYLQMYYRLGMAGRLLDRFGVVDFATTIAPGVRDVLLTGKVYEAAHRRTGGAGSNFVYDAVVVDAPPTGRIAKFLAVNDDVAELAKVGPVRSQSESIMTMMRAESTFVHLVTVLEEMPVQETLDGITELEAEGLPMGQVIVNMVRPPLLSQETIDALESGRLDTDLVGAVLASVSLDTSAAEGLIAGGWAHMERQQLQYEQQLLLEASGYAPVYLPMVVDGIDAAGLGVLAEHLAEAEVSA